MRTERFDLLDPHLRFDSWVPRFQGSPCTHAFDPPDQSGKLRDMDNVAFFFHMLGVLLFVSGMVLAGAAFEAARRRDSPSEIVLLLGFTRIGVVLVGIGSLVTPVFGLWLVHLGNFGYGSGWVDASIALYAAALALGGLGGRRPRQARLLAAQLALGDAPTSVELRALLNDTLSRAANYGSAAIVLTILVLMVFK